MNERRPTLSILSTQREQFNFFHGSWEKNFKSQDAIFQFHFCRTDDQITVKDNFEFIGSLAKDIGACEGPEVLLNCTTVNIFALVTHCSSNVRADVACNFSDMKSGVHEGKIYHISLII